MKKYINDVDYDDDKLLDTNVDQYLLYTPDYYIDKIRNLLRNPDNQFIYIISDSDNLVKEFIIKPTKKFNNNNRIIFLENFNTINSFYLLCNASYIIMSCSIFSFAASYINKKKADCELLLYHYDPTKDIIPAEEYATSPDWIINDDKKYILNYNVKKAFNILKFKYHWRY